MQDRAYRVKLSVNVKLLACSVSTIELCLSMRISCKVHCLQKSEGEILSCPNCALREGPHKD
uniref:Uncharacterized protein n=2 Tax=Meloidogyne TaxID=189290 RepID=A0A6V7V7Y6_MELEN|nr:unnamed protein product [Meloidogyne enterolobii]